MPDANNIKELIALIPLVLNHIAPGYIFYSVILHQIGNKENNYPFMISNSIIYSFCINSILGIFIYRGSKWFPIWAVGLSLFLSILLINVIEGNLLTNIAFKLSIFKAAKKDLISDIVDSKLGMWLYVYIESEQVIYMGKLIKYEDRTDDNHRYVLLSEYTCYSYGGEELTSFYEDITKCALINIANVIRIEAVYNENSKKLNKVKKES